MFKCKACARELEISDGALTAVCPHCNTKQTLPETENKRIVRLHERASAHISARAFGKAEKLYRKIIKNNGEDAEAYFGLALCRYGVGYVKLSDTYSLFVSREVADSFFTDENYKASVKLSDKERAAIYKSLAKNIVDLCEIYRLDNAYNNALSVMTSAKTSKRFSYAAELFGAISWHGDAADKARECQEKAVIFEEKEIKRRNFNKYTLTPAVFASVVFILCALFSFFELMPMLKYIDAIDLVDAGEFESASEIIDELDGYKDIYKLEARIFAEKGEFESACAVLEHHGVDPAKFPLADAYKYASEGDYASAVKSGLYSVTLPEGTVEIYPEAFINCPELEKVRIPESVTSIGRHAFWFCTGLKNTELPENLTVIENGAFGGSGLESIVIPASVTHIGKDAFRACAALESITIPAGIESIGENAFSECENLTVYFAGTVDEWKKINATDYGDVITVDFGE